MSISALNKDTVKLLTTTQIITSISSAAKELIENAFDADAKNIEINLIDNGCTLIEVKDDGCGISKIDAPYVALSSYTSKIGNFSDLDLLETYGFRGEALYALCAVSDVTIISKTEQDEAAVSYTIDHSGCIIKSESCHRSKGTTVQVRQLFKQVPVRRQIITNPKKANQDIKILESLIKSYAMCKFFARITYRVNNNVVFAKPSMVTFEEAVTYVLGKKLTCNMSWIDTTDTDIKMKLMVPSKDTQNMLEAFQSGLQYIFVNNRPIKHKELEKAMTKTIFEVLGQELLPKKKPIFVLYILINAANIDVNLEPNKASILFKDQSIVIGAIEKHLESFYGIIREVQQETVCDISFTSYQDYSQKEDISHAENEMPACKKRKLHTERCIDKPIEKIANADEDAANNLNFNETNNSKHTKKPQISTNGQVYLDKNAEKCDKNVETFDTELPLLYLSDSDSNNSQNFTLIYDNSNSRNSFNKEVTEDSPPFELTPTSETLSQLPIVNLGDDFEWNNRSTINADKNENKIQNANLEVSNKENKPACKEETPVTLKEWSKGHVFGLKGGTNVESYNYTDSNESVKEDTHGNLCGGFLKFSGKVRAQVTEQNPTITAPQVAHIITNLWKKLSPEERGYYKDLASDERLEHDIQKQKIQEKHVINTNKDKNRLLKALNKMKIMNLTKKENLVTRTIVPWNINLKKVTENFIDNSSYENTNSVIGLLCLNLWIVQKSAHIWIVDARELRKELHKADTNTNEDSAENIEQLLQQWFSIKDDLSLLHPIHSITQNKNSS
ncbi:PMS1 protein homolog 1 [Anthophora quadrimaculata]